MLQKNLMEDKQLNFNQPLLSVRRFSSIVNSKKEVKRKTNHSFPDLPLLPAYKSELKSGPVKNQGTVPFIWEQAPGRPKDRSKSETAIHEQFPIIPKLPPGRITVVKHQAPEKGPQDSQSTSLVENNTVKFESSKDAMEETESSNSGDSDETYLDAVDRLSRSESFYLNCSLSGLSGLEGPEVQPSETFSTDPQTRDFMMGRFLPAAKAMASETPPHGSRRQPAGQEELKQLRKVISGDKRPLVYRSRPNILPNYTEDNRAEESSSDDDEHGHLSYKVCGLLPSFCFLNPVPGMGLRTRVPIPHVSRSQARSISAGPRRETDNERVRLAIREKRPLGGPPKTEPEYKNLMRNKHSQVHNQSSSQKLEGSSLYRRLQGRGISHQQSELPQSCFFEEKSLLQNPKKAEIDESSSFTSQKSRSNSFRKLLADESIKRETGSAGPVTEKTVYVDSVHKVASPRLNSFSSDRKGQSNSNHIDFEAVTKSEETPSVDSLLKYIENSKITCQEVLLHPKSVNSYDFDLQSVSGIADRKVGIEMLKGFGQDRGLNDHEVEDHWQLMNVKNLETPQGIDSQFPLPPPLPNSPSESWLCRTLPSMSSKNPSSHPQLGTRMNLQYQVLKMPIVEPKGKRDRL